MKVRIKIMRHMPLKPKGFRVTGTPVLAHLGTKNLGGRINTVCYQFLKKKKKETQTAKQSNKQHQTKKTHNILTRYCHNCWQ